MHDEIDDVCDRLADILMAAVLRAVAIGETRGFVKMLIEVHNGRILGFTSLGTETDKMMAVVVQTAMPGLSYTVLRDAIFAHPTAPEGLGPLLASVLASFKGSSLAPCPKKNFTVKEPVLAQE